MFYLLTIINNNKYKFNKSKKEMQNINTQIKRKFKKPNSMFLNSDNRKELITKFQIENNYIKYSCKIYTIYENDFYKTKKN